MPTTELDHENLILIEALAAGRTHQQAADDAGCSAKTVQRRVHEPAFAQALRERRAERLDQFATSLEASAATALDTLNDLMSSENDTVRIAAVRIALTEHVRYRNTAEHETRLVELEAIAAKISAT